MDCDKILSLQDGHVSEYASPRTLLGLPGATSSSDDLAPSGLFKSLVTETGPETAATLMAMADK
jgi:hypothetical protein